MNHSRARSQSTESIVHLSALDNSDDEIIWGAAASDDDLVVLTRSIATKTTKPTTSDDDDVGLADDLSRLSLATTSPKRRRRHRRPSPPATPPPVVAPVPKSSPPRRRKKALKNTGLGMRPIVDDLSELPDTASERSVSPFSSYDAAASYISAFLEHNTPLFDRLTFLQCLLVELGLASSTLPASLRAAKAIIKSNVFLNIGEYLEARQEGPAAIQSILHPSRSSLIRDLRARKRDAMVPRHVVKDSGLQVLLVRCYH
uniref:Uncharacterized protein n=1 Tax=Mycena chlorophos TaxID=658473 RepID=A0ABQ0L0D6_MYCCL|nr:predicted protein [Mycena chlorophos]